MIAERYPTQEVADIEIYGNTKKLRAVMKNLSKTGAGLEVVGKDLPIKKGDLINITIQLSSLAKTHNVDAEVVWSDGLALGVSFVSKDEVVQRIFMRSSV